MGSNKQNSVKVSQEHKAVLAAVSGLTHSTKVDCNPQSIKELVSGGLETFQDHVLQNHENGLQPDDVGMNFYILYDDEVGTKQTALMDRLPKEIKIETLSLMMMLIFRLSMLCISCLAQIG